MASLPKASPIYSFWVLYVFASGLNVTRTSPLRRRCAATASSLPIALLTAVTVSTGFRFAYASDVVRIVTSLPWRAGTISRCSHAPALLGLVVPVA
ncbi:hypothetical protein VM1G_11523 [Cytospora mali]|uniref:Uncharacterized protein n=1 Tax=Cytospora mali TaxID=578113 RepID=A0A194VYV7_CYTMA|nr:hypothetical protein VM1G_11523 [Valsa mali]